MNIAGILTKILEKLVTAADPSSISDEIISRRIGTPNTEAAVIEKISLKIMNNHPGTSLSFIKLITKEVVAEFKTTYPQHQQGNS